MGGTVENPQNQNSESKELSPVKALILLDQFLQHDLEKIINENMAISDSHIHVIMIQHPNFYRIDYDRKTAYTKGIVSIGGKHYPIEVMADLTEGIIDIMSEVFGVEVSYDFINNKLEDFDPEPPEPVIAKAYFGYIIPKKYFRNEW